MAFKWPNKDPDEQLDYSIDWSRYLDTATISCRMEDRQCGRHQADVDSYYCG